MPNTISLTQSREGENIFINVILKRFTRYKKHVVIIFIADWINTSPVVPSTKVCLANGAFSGNAHPQSTYIKECLL
jgi:hypothetical protein